MKRRIEELYLEYGAMVYRRCLAVLGEEEAAYDALQEVFLKLLDSDGALERMESPVSYLYSMATNFSLNAQRRERRRGRLPPEAMEEIGDEREDGLAASLLLELLCSELGERTRAIAYYRYRDGMGLDEIAELAGLSRSAVRKHLDKFKARARSQKERIV